ncbi:MAG: alpha-1,4-glucan--maltose-1-phosphate maltosyltransferase [Rubrivivax sp.]
MSSVKTARSSSVPRATPTASSAAATQRAGNTADASSTAAALAARAPTAAVQATASASGVHPIGFDDGRVRVVIETITPAVDGGRFPIKRVLGDAVTVEADCFADGHDVVACALHWCAGAGAPWQQIPMVALGNDRWRAAFKVDSLGLWQYRVQAWVDPFLSWQHDFTRRIEPDDVRIAAQTGALLIGEAAARARTAGSKASTKTVGDSARTPNGADGGDARSLTDWAAKLTQAATPDSANRTDTEALKRIGGDADLGALAERHPDLRHAQFYPVTYGITVEPVRARFSTWYEFFPRSASDDATRHGTFTDCEAWLPYIKRMGFDVLYFPPIHPIGRSKRKGPNNTLQAEPDHVGSPWAIGATEGGHQAILPELGTLDDFKRLTQKAAGMGIDLALDVAFQCAPDHPWVKQHPAWFKKRADGSIQYAENPPKKYQDIYPFDFESEDWPAMWEALAGVFEYWIGHGVHIFRVDNPHTKAFPFWEWAIARIKAKSPEVIFLSEAFTRPRVMHRLAKVGFSQSYTYYTWRNTKHELTEYFTELSAGPGTDYFRPNVWPNTPDILPAALQHGGRAVFMSRVAMAATLAASYGLYGPAYELSVGAALRAGGEEYMDSEKFQRHVWDRKRADSLAEFIGVLNRARHENRALQSDSGLVFLPIDNDQMLAYAKMTPDKSNIIVCIVNLDPHHMHSGWLDIDLARFGLVEQQPYQMHDLISGAHFLWQGSRNFVQLDPHRSPVHVMKLRSHLRRENEFDYYA